jgi:hypothetical protein
MVGLDDCRLGLAVVDHHLIDVRARDLLEGGGGEVLGPDLHLAFVECRVAAFGDNHPRLERRLASLFQAEVGVGADRKFFLDFADSVTVAPKSAAGWRDFAIQAAFVRNLVGLVLRFERLGLILGQRRVGLFPVWFCKSPQKARKASRNV